MFINSTTYLISSLQHHTLSVVRLKICYASDFPFLNMNLVLLWSSASSIYLQIIDMTHSSTIFNETCKSEIVHRSQDLISNLISRYWVVNLFNVINATTYLISSLQHHSWSVVRLKICYAHYFPFLIPKLALLWSSASSIQLQIIDMTNTSTIINETCKSEIVCRLQYLISNPISRYGVVNFFNVYKRNYLFDLLPAASFLECGQVEDLLCT